MYVCIYIYIYIYICIHKHTCLYIIIIPWPAGSISLFVIKHVLLLAFTVFVLTNLRLSDVMLCMFSLRLIRFDCCCMLGRVIVLYKLLSYCFPRPAGTTWLPRRPCRCATGSPSWSSPPRFVISVINSSSYCMYVLFLCSYAVLCYLCMFVAFTCVYFYCVITNHVCLFVCVLLLCLFVLCSYCQGPREHPHPR